MTPAGTIALPSNECIRPALAALNGCTEREDSLLTQLGTMRRLATAAKCRLAEHWLLEIVGAPIVHGLTGAELRYSPYSPLGGPNGPRYEAAIEALGRCTIRQDDLSSQLVVMLLLADPAGCTEASRYITAQLAHIYEGMARHMLQRVA